MADTDVKGGRDGICRYVIMGRAYAAGREDIGVTRPQRIHGRDDLILLIGHDADFTNRYA